PPVAAVGVSSPDPEGSCPPDARLANAARDHGMWQGRSGTVLVRARLRTWPSRRTTIATEDDEMTRQRKLAKHRERPTTNRDDHHGDSAAMACRESSAKVAPCVADGANEVPAQ